MRDHRFRQREYYQTIMGFSDRPLDNPINWSFRVGRLFGIDIRLHIAFVICAIVLVAMEMPKVAAAPSMPPRLPTAAGATRDARGTPAGAAQGVRYR